MEVVDEEKSMANKKEILELDQKEALEWAEKNFDYSWPPFSLLTEEVLSFSLVLSLLYSFVRAVSAFISCIS